MQNTVLDERQEQINNKSLASAGIVAIIFSLVMMIYYFLKKDLGSSMPHVILLILMCIAFDRSKKQDIDNYFRTTMFGIQIDYSKTKAAFAKRSFLYLLSTLATGAMFCLFTLFLDGKAGLKEFISDGYIFIFVFFACTIIYNEIQVSKYNKKIKFLENEENEFDISD